MNVKAFMDVGYLRRVLFCAVSALFLVGFVLYLLYHVTGGFAVKVKTVVAEYSTRQATLFVDAYILRDEVPVYSNYGGVINYYVSDGEKLGHQSVIADVYSGSADSAVRRQIIAIDKKIQLLQACSVGDDASVAGVAGIDDAIANQLYAIRENILNNRFDYAVKAKDSLLYQLNRRQLITTEQRNFSDAILQLQQERARLAATQTGVHETVTAPATGYFYGAVDGYEYLFTAGKADTMTVSEFAAMTGSPPDQNVLSQNDKYSVGKVAKDQYWYLACRVDKRLLGEYEQGKTYFVTFPYSDNKTLEMTLYRIVTEDNNPEAVLVFSSSVISQNFSFLRRQKAEISFSAPLAGYKVPASAIRILDGETGVYVQYGSRIYFKIAEILGELDGYCYIRAGVEGKTLFAGDDIEGNEIYCQGLRQNDHVVVEGTGLYHGKYIG